MKPLHAIVASAMLSLGVAGCVERPNFETPLTINYPLLIDHAYWAEIAARKLLPENKPKPPKEKSESMVVEVENKNGEKVYKTVNYVVEDLPPKIEKVDFDRHNVSVTISNRGFNHDYLEYVAVIDLKKRTTVRKGKNFDPAFDREECEDHDMISEEGEIIPRYCSFNRTIWFDKLEEPGTYKYVVEVKDHHHTVRSKPFTIKIGEPGEIGEPEKLPLPPKEETVYNYSKVKKSNGGYVIKKRSKIIKDHPPKIEKIVPEFGGFLIEIRNEGLNYMYLEYIAVIDSEKKVIAEKTEFSDRNRGCWYEEGWEKEDGWVSPKHCLFSSHLSFDKPKAPGTYKYIIEVKDHYHTVRSPFIIQVEGAK